MPKSAEENKTPIMDLLKSLKSKSILELGVGYGEFAPKIRIEIPGSKLFGIEIFEPYFQKIPHNCYERLYNEDMRFFDYDKLKGVVDTVLMVDVLEHVEKDEGYELLSKLESMFDKIIVCVPIIEFEQGPFMGNDWEEHKAQWKREDFKEMGYNEQFIGKIVGVFYKC